jgi:hypothetical protein
MTNKILCIGELLIEFIRSDVNIDLTGGINFIFFPVYLTGGRSLIKSDL